MRTPSHRIANYSPALVKETTRKPHQTISFNHNQLTQAIPQPQHPTNTISFPLIENVLPTKKREKKEGEGKKIKNGNRLLQDFDFVNIVDTQLLVQDDTERNLLTTKGYSLVVVVVEEVEVTMRSYFAN